ncbi:hypothetical protein ACJRO7_021903 [Eucalyptus globulus]|uniref:F-box domain-containing protein n=1 Tax=Eucalyptus globulus TaxID=34317 RepID=A0ABD3KMV9_EUCGL
MDKRRALVIAGPDNSKGEFCVGRCERLCDLPDPLLHHILGFLPLKELIRTSVLTSRWRSLWASLPNLVFDELRLPDRRRFLQYMDWALSCRDLSHVKSSLSVHQDAYSIYSWINFAINCKVQTLGNLCLWNCWHLKALTVSTLNLLSLFIKQRTTKSKLELFSYIGGHLSECAIRDTSVLRDAHLVLGGPTKGIYASRAHKLLKDLSTAKRLFLHYYILERSISSQSSLASTSCHSTLMIDDLSILAMLNNCPCLVKLLFCECFQLSLKFITIEEFDATDDQLLAIMIILRPGASVVDLLESVQLLLKSSDKCFISLSPMTFSMIN